jgi:integrase
MKRKAKFKSEIKGLRIERSSYFLDRQFQGKRFRETIGRVNDISLEEAEEIARKKIKDIKEYGVDTVKQMPKAISTTQASGRTLKAVLEDYIKTGSSYGTTKTSGEPIALQTIEGYRKLERNAWKPLMNLPIKAINREVIINWYTNLLDTSREKGFTYIHNDALRKLTRIFNWALHKDWLEINYAERVYKSNHRVPSKKRKSVEEERFDLEKNELGVFVKGLLRYRTTQNKRNNDTTRDLILTYIFTGGRRNEIKQMQWSWFDDLENFGSFTSPKAATKTSKEYYYPCCVLLQEMFKRRYLNRKALAEKLEGKSPLKYVFPDSTGKTFIQDVRGRINLVVKASGLKKNITPHSFRFTFGDIAKRNGYEQYHIVDALHHQNPSMTFGTYAKTTKSPKFHSLFQDVESYVSKSLPLSTETLDSQLVSFSGLVKVSLDNKSIDDDRVADEEALRDILSGKRREEYIASRIPAVQEINFEFLKKKFPNIMEDYYEKIDIENDIATLGKKLGKKTVAKMMLDNPSRYTHWSMEYPKLAGQCNGILLQVGKALGLKEPEREVQDKLPDSYIKAIEENTDYSQLELLKTFRKEYFIRRKKVSKCVDYNSLHTQIRAYETQVSMERMFELLIEKTKDEKIIAQAKRIKEMFARVVKKNMISDTSRYLKSHYILSKDNPILKKYYDDLEKTKEEKKVIQFKKATA